MHIISFDKEALNITICNLYPNLELTSPVYCSNGTTCHVSPSQQADISNTIFVSFGIDSRQRNVKGAVLYKLWRKYTTKTDDLTNNAIEDTAPNMYFLVAWSLEYGDHKFYACLIECTDDFTWDEDKLWALYKEYNDQFYEYYDYNPITWLIHGDAVIKTKFGTWKYFMEEPMKIDPKRLVLSLPMMIVLIYDVSLSIRPSIKLNIHNQCLNIDVVSPIYVTSDKLECHISPNYKVCAGDTIRSSFTVKSDDEADGALICRLQRRLSHEFTEIGKDTSNIVHLLVIWEISEFNELYTDVLLVKHEEGFDWSKDDLEELYRKDSNRFRLYSDSVTEAWSLDDNTALMVTSEIMNGDCILNIIISEIKRDNSTRMPVYIDLKR
jgi:hypothetical protein